MLFNSLAFAVFFIIVFTLYWILPHKDRWLLILAASYYFYMSWNAAYVVLILFTTVVSYTAAILVERTEDKKQKKWILAGCAVACLGVLFFFKYFNFLSESVRAVLGMLAIPMHPVVLHLLLPVGISFYTFQTLSYVIDVYRGDVPAEHHFGYYAAFISFFPQLVAGPIERTGNLLPQIKAEHRFDYDQATYGLKLMTWGLFKKIVIADTLSVFVSKVYDRPQLHYGFALVLATVFFAFQIYCDFSGYSDMAIGTAKMLGINLMTNFKSPYYSQSIREFWGRWHISLSTWFRDYVYIPLGGSRVGKLRHWRNLLITFLISGLWHGANWTFVIWGMIHGLGQVIESVFLPKDKAKLQTRKPWYCGAGRMLLTFLFTTFAWIFFVSNSVQDALYVIGHLLDGISSPILYLYSGLAELKMSKIEFLVIAVLVLILMVYDYLSMQMDVIAEISQKSVAVRYMWYIFLLCLILYFRAASPAEFVYFQF